MSRKQDLGPGAEKIELERRLDANQDKMEQARSTGGQQGRSASGRPAKDQADPNDAVRIALDKARH